MTENLTTIPRPSATDLSQTITIFSSTSVSVTTSIPQGSHFGPVLYLLYINDATKIFSYLNTSYYKTILTCFLDFNVLKFVIKAFSH